MHPTKARIIIQKKSPMKECIGKDSMPSLLLFFQHCCSRTDYLAWQIRVFPKERLSDFYSNGRIHSSFVLLIRTWNLASVRYCAVHKNGLGVPCTTSQESQPLHRNNMMGKSTPGLKETYKIGLIQRKVYPYLLIINRQTDGPVEII